jgi:hypothetical protein
MNMLILAAIGVVVLAVSTVGLAASLSTTPAFNLIGASDNNVVNAARGNLTEIVWTDEISNLGVTEMNLITFTVGNEDLSAAHTFQVCAVIEGPVAVFSPAAGSPPECVTTSSIAASAKLTGQTISFTNPVNVTSIVDFSFSIEELN